MADAGVASAPAEAAQAAVPAVIPDYQRGDLVWAKIKGFPWWPSQIRSVRNLRQRSEDHVPYVRVRFLHTKDNAEVAPDKLLPYTEANAELGIVKPKMFKSDGLKKKFLTAVAQADTWQPPPPAEPEEWSDDEVVEQEEVEAARAEASAHRAAWRSEGHELLGQHVARFFGASQGPKVRAYLAVITRWSPWEDTNLFHVLHDDGDEEDLEEEEVRKAISAYRRQPEARRRKHEQHVAKEEKQRKAEERARQPRKPRSALASFSQAVRPALLAAHPAATATELSRLVMAAWREADARTHAEHEATAAADRQRYLAECAAVGVAPDGEGDGRAHGPLPPLPALGFFRERCEVALGVRLGGDEAELGPAVAELLHCGFRQLPAEEREELEDLAAADLERYKDEVASWQSKQAAHAKRRAHAGGAKRPRAEE